MRRFFIIGFSFILLLLFAIPVYAADDMTSSDDSDGGLLSGILDGFIHIFIPDEDFLNSQIDRLTGFFQDRFGIVPVDVSGILGAEVQIDDDNYKVDSYNGIDLKGNSFLNTSWLKTAITTFRPYIRGLFVLFMIFYNINQFVSFIGAGNISSTGSAVSTALSKSNDD